MPKLKRIKIKKIKEFFKKIPRTLGEHAFLTSLLFIFISSILGGLVFYKYIILAEQKKSEVLEKPLLFNEETFQEVQKIWENRQKRFEEAESKEYSNPFRRID